MIYIFSIDRGEAMLLNSHVWRAQYKNRYHFSKEALYAAHTSQVVVQGSPLLVRIVLDQVKNIFMYNISLTGNIALSHTLAESLWNNRQIC